MFLVYISAILTTVLFALSLAGVSDGLAGSGFILAIAVILWLTCLFSNFAEAIAEGRGKAQADTLRASKRDVMAHRLADPADHTRTEEVSGASLNKGDYFLVSAGEQIPADGEVVEGAASVDESAITGESAPVIREAGGDRSAVTGGTTVLSDFLVVRVTQEAGNSFLDQMIAMVEGANRKKTPNEIALQILLVALSIIFVLVTASLYAYSLFSADQLGMDNPTSIVSLVALLICLAPTTIGALLSAIGIAGMSRLNQANVLAMSGRAIEAAGDVDVLLLDKTGHHHVGQPPGGGLPAGGRRGGAGTGRRGPARLAPRRDPGGAVHCSAGKRALRHPRAGSGGQPRDIHSLYGADPHERCGLRRRGGTQGRCRCGKGLCGGFRQSIQRPVCGAGQRGGQTGGNPLVVAKNHRILGVIHLKDIIKDGVKEKFADLRTMGIRTIMITGDNPVTAAAIAAEAGVDDFLSEATPETKLAMIRKFQAEGHLVAMTGDGTNDALPWRRPTWRWP